MADISNRWRPIVVTFEDGVSNIHRNIVIHSIISILQYAQVDQKIRIIDAGVWRHTDGHMHENGFYVPYWSVDWYIAKGFQASRNRDQAHVREIFLQLWQEPWQEQMSHYDVMILNSDIYDEGCNFVIGSAIKGFGTVISINRFLNLAEPLRSQCIESEVIHEVGHVFGLVPETRTTNVTESLGKHCTCRCIMRQGLAVPRDWIQFSRDRITSGQPFCPQCLIDLRNYFCRG